VGSKNISSLSHVGRRLPPTPGRKGGQQEHYFLFSCRSWITLYTWQKRWAQRTLFPSLPFGYWQQSLAESSLSTPPPRPSSHFSPLHLSSNVGTKTEICQERVFLYLSQQNWALMQVNRFVIIVLIDMEGINNLVNIMIECSEH
jgi:hypothetical protein